MEQEPQLPQKQNTSKTKIILTVLMFALLSLYWLFVMTPFITPDFSLSNIVVEGSGGLYLYVPIVSTLLAILLLFFAYNNLKIWDKLYKIVTTLYIFMMTGYVTGMIFSSIYYRYSINNNYNLDAPDYVSVEPSNLMLVTLSMSILAEIIALTVIWFYAKIDNHK